MADKMFINNKPKLCSHRDASDDSVGLERDQFSPASTGSGTVRDAQHPKQKGGRKPIYITAEDRKRRNRQAQALFRERRSEYIKKLEKTIQDHEANMHRLQATHSTTVDECVILRHKNSLLESMNFQADPKASTNRPYPTSTYGPPNILQPPTLQQVMANQHCSKSSSNMARNIMPTFIIEHPFRRCKATVSSESQPAPAYRSLDEASSAMPSAASDCTSATSSEPHQVQTTSLRKASFYPTTVFQNGSSQPEQTYNAQTNRVRHSLTQASRELGASAVEFDPNGTEPIILSPAHDDTELQGNESRRQSEAGYQSYESMAQLVGQNIHCGQFSLRNYQSFLTQGFQFDQNM